MGLRPGYKHTDAGVIPQDWDCELISSVALLESGHTPSKKKPCYWGGSVQWVSLHDTTALEGPEIAATAKTITEEGLNHSSARLLPPGTVVFSRTATVGKSTVMATSMATSQDFANYICGPKLHNHYLVYLFRSMGYTWQRLMAGSIHNTIYMPAFKALKIPVPPLAEQRSIASALSDVDGLLSCLDQLIAKKRNLKQAAMQQLLTGHTRLPGFQRKWGESRLGALGSIYGGLTGKTKSDFGDGEAKYITFTNVMKNVVIDCSLFEPVRVSAAETQNLVARGDLLLNGSSETPEEVALCSLMDEDVPNLFLNSFCFGFRLKVTAGVDGLFLAYYIRSAEGRELMKALAQGSTRYNLSKGALLDALVRLPGKEEQVAIASVLSDMDAELSALETRREKTISVKRAMMQELLTGRIRLT